MERSFSTAFGPEEPLTKVRLGRKLLPPPPHPPPPPPFPRGPQGKPLPAKPNEAIDSGLITHHLEFKDDIVRSKFVGKVYFILFLIHLTGTLISSTFTLREDLKMFVRENPSLRMVPIALGVLICMGICLIEIIRRKFPLNFIAMIFLVSCASVFLGFLTVLNFNETWPHAFAFTTNACLFIAVASYFFKFPTVNWGRFFLLMLIVNSLHCSVVILYTSFNGYTKIRQTYKAYFLSLLYITYLAWDTVEILRHGRPKMEAKDHCHAALHHFIDILLLVGNFLKYLGLCKEPVEL